MTSNHQFLLTVSVNVLTNSVYCEKHVLHKRAVSPSLK